jgi:hypothetical protein
VAPALLFSIYTADVAQQVSAIIHNDLTGRTDSLGFQP